MSTPPATPWYLKLPAKLGATVFFLVALTTLIGNVMDLDEKRRAQAKRDARDAATAAATPSPALPLQAALPAPPPEDTSPVRLVLALERIVVGSDGGFGTTDWRFAVEADGQPLFVLQQDALDDTAGRNVALPADARGALRVPREGGARVSVKGWRGSRLRLPTSAPDASGEGTLQANGEVAPVVVEAADPARGAFVLHFSARDDD